MYVVVPVFAVFLALSGVAQAAPPEIGGPVTVIDGDTFDIGGTRVRLHGIDAPESDQTCVTERAVAWACGTWVNEIVRERYAGKMARCQPRDTDRYGRAVARCEVEGEDVGAYLVSRGAAFAYRRYSLDYHTLELEAARQDAGLHASRVQAPTQFRKARAVGLRPPDSSCRIKGNISAAGVHIYHAPGQRDYNRTVIRPDKDERWFCNAAEAEAAGWRAARR
ncbi:thermonuclease family protein [Roseobacter weihaiensis]|uniref:thermonuclease family protein n=1 Tax=Roseobacter weihaiensis TaxID=2763262 RepID=UPI001D0BCA68|nr:thermonuclease family protein [Roseobacter sp. H9]